MCFGDLQDNAAMPQTVCEVWYMGSSELRNESVHSKASSLAQQSSRHFSICLCTKAEVNMLSMLSRWASSATWRWSCKPRRVTSRRLQRWSRTRCASTPDPDLRRHACLGGGIGDRVTI